MIDSIRGCTCDVKNENENAEMLHEHCRRAIGRATLHAQGGETKEEFLGRLRTIATSLPKSYIKSVIAKMRPNLKALKDARRYTPKND